MELIIILLISVEVVIVSSKILSDVSVLTERQCLIRDGPEMWDIIFGKKDLESKAMGSESS